MSEVINFDDDPVIEPILVVVKGVEYLLHEASEKAAISYRNNSFKSFTLGKGGSPTKIDGLASVEPSLVADCLTEKDSGKNVSITTLLEWPSRYVTQLFERVKKISNLHEGNKDFNEALKSALDLPDSPISYSKLYDFVSELPSSDYKAIQDAFEIDEEELAKNS
jgi:hypothetical protein